MQMMDQLTQCELFEGIIASDIQAVLACVGGTVHGYQRGECFLSEGDKPRKLGIVLSGEMQIESYDYKGNRSIVAKAEPMQIVGEAFACARINEVPVSVLAVEDTDVLCIDVERITSTCSNACAFHNQLVMNLLQLVARKNLELNAKIDIMTQRTTREKLLTYLVRMRRDGSNIIEIPFNRQELADYLGVERSGLSQEISKLRRDGTIQCDKNRFVLKKTIDSSNLLW